MARRRRAKSSRRALLVSVVVVVLSLVATTCDNDDGGSVSPPGPDAGVGDAALPPGDDVVVGRIVDGDTLRTTDEERVRLLNIDTPEPSDDECWADEATAALEALAPVGTPIRLVYDRERLDRYGRTLAHVYRRADGLWVNLQMAREGAARPYVLRPNDARYEPILEAADDARDSGLGLWGACANDG